MRPPAHPGGLRHGPNIALRFPEFAFLGAESARAVLDQFRRALPRNLVFALAASAR
jgi:hypothetical protein